jgi:hypothetical protein
MSHAALALILERGRPITRRVLVTSSPLYQPMVSAEELGYEVRVYMRVPDIGGGQDRRPPVVPPLAIPSSAPTATSSVPATSSRSKRHSRKLSGHTSTESDQTGAATKSLQHSLGSSGSNSGASISSRHHHHHQQQTSTSITAASLTPTAAASGNAGTTGGGRIRYREQGVDELLQLKLHQAIADVDEPPPNATIVLATGDGNVGQFNEEGFLGPVRTALKKGWRVELYAWEGGLSKAWMREFGDGPWKDRFKIVGLEQFGVDLLQM